MIAANIADLTKDPILARLAVAPFMPAARQIVHAEGNDRLDGDAVVLDCGDATGAALVQVVRMRYSKHAFRFYQKSGGGAIWRRI